MRTEPRCSQCDSEDPKIISVLRVNTTADGSASIEGQENFIRWMRRANAEAAS